MGLGISYQDKAVEYRQRSTASMSRKSAYVPKTQKASATKNDGDVLSLSHNSGCTDGKDDGKIGFFSAVGNAIVGAGKSIVNGIKGCFTDKNGNFSIGKTLLTIGMGAACVAFPAVGLVACGIGAVTGGVQVAKGIGKAVTAETDAEAKEAWQNIGAGGVTVAASAAGAKASYNAVLKTSTAGATAALGKDATIGQKAAALGKDMWSSTKNSAASLKQAATTAKEAAELANARRKAGKIDQTGALTDAERATLRELEAREAFGSDAAKAMADKAKLPTKQGVVDGLKNAGKTAKSTPSKVLKAVKDIKAKGVGNSIKGLPGNVRNIITALNESSYSAVVQKYGYENVVAAIETFSAYRLTDENI